MDSEKVGVGNVRVDESNDRVALKPKWNFS